MNEGLLFNTRKIYVRGSRKVKSKSVADVVEALIGAFLSTCGETAALIFMDWMGIKVDFHITPYERHFQVQAEKLLNVRHLQFLLNYPFNDPSLLVEALTHGSYAEIPRSYQVRDMPHQSTYISTFFCCLHHTLDGPFAFYTHENPFKYIFSHDLSLTSIS